MNAQNGTSRTNQILILVAVFSIIVVTSFVVPRVAGQNAGSEQSLEISPPSQELTGDPGRTVTVKAKVRNRTNSNLPIKARTEDFIAQGEGGQVALVEKGPWSVSNWTTLTPSEFTLKPGEVKEVTGTIRIPTSGAGGGRYGSIVFAVTGAASGPGNAAVSQEVASLFLLRINGPVDEKLSIEQFSAPSFSEFGPVTFQVNYANAGNVHLKPQGIISITNMFGQKVADVVVDPANVFPQAKRAVTAKWNKQLLFGSYTATAIVFTGGSKNETATATASFTVFPIRIAVLVGLALLAVYLMRKRLSKALKALAGK